MLICVECVDALGGCFFPSHCDGKRQRLLIWCCFNESSCMLCCWAAVAGIPETRCCLHLYAFVMLIISLSWATRGRKSGTEKHEATGHALSIVVSEQIMEWLYWSVIKRIIEGVRFPVDEWAVDSLNDWVIEQLHEWVGEQLSEWWMGNKWENDCCLNWVWYWQRDKVYVAKGPEVSESLESTI